VVFAENRRSTRQDSARGERRIYFGSEAGALPKPTLDPPGLGAAGAGRAKNILRFRSRCFAETDARPARTRRSGRGASEEYTSVPKQVLRRNRRSTRQDSAQRARGERRIYFGSEAGASPKTDARPARTRRSGRGASEEYTSVPKYIFCRGRPDLAAAPMRAQAGTRKGFERGRARICFGSEVGA